MALKPGDACAASTISAKELREGFLSPALSNTSPCNVSVGVLSRETRTRVAGLYRSDFERFAYSLELMTDAEAALRKQRLIVDEGESHGLRRMRESEKVLVYA